VRPLPALILITIGFSPMLAHAEGRSISSLGRLEPLNGVTQLSGPSGGASGSVIKELSVNEGDLVEKGQVVAYLDSYALRKAEVARLQAILNNADSEMTRQRNLSKTSATSKVRFDAAAMELNIAKADLAAARAKLELSVVRSPIDAQILEIHSRPGERVNADGVMDLGQTDQMYAVAEVYETDIVHVKEGQKAWVSTAALEERWPGKVERISLKVGRMDVLGTDPIAKTDARVVEVFIRLDSSESVSRFTNMQVQVEIEL